MNTTYKSCDKYIRNQLFSSLEEQENQYECKTRRFEEKQSRYDTQNLKEQNQNIKTQKLFNQRSNFIDLTQSIQVNKQLLTKSSLHKQVKIKQSQFEAEQSSKDLVDQVKKERFLRSDVKPKKKSSQRRNNLKQFFLEIQDKVDQDQDKGILQNNISSINQSQTDKKQFFEPQNFQVQSQQNKKELDELSQLKENLSKFSQNQNGITSRTQGLSLQGLDYLKNNKFNFLHNDLDLDSSSGEQEEEIEDSVKQSDSSENDFDQIAFEMPKIRSKKNIFIKSSDLDFDSSDQQKNEQNQDQQDHIQESQNQQNNKKSEKMSHRNSESNSSTNCQRNITVSDFRREFVSHSQEYLKKSLPSNTSIDLIVKRDKSKHEYYIYDSKTLKQIVVIAKKSSSYEIYAKTNVQNPRAHPDLKYLTAKVDTNFLGTEFNLKYIQHEFSHQNTSQKDQIAATISYQTNFLGFNGPRKMHVYIPENSQIKYHEDKLLKSLYQKKCGHRIDKYVNKQAKWNEQVKSYVLNMKGKAKLSSVKNFVIVIDSKQQQKKDKSFVIFGKNSKDIFNLTISGPFSILQGISIGLSSFQRKITCE